MRKPSEKAAFLVAVAAGGLTLRVESAPDATTESYVGGGIRQQSGLEPHGLEHSEADLEAWTRIRQSIHRARHGKNGELGDATTASLSALARKLEDLQKHIPRPNVWGSTPDGDIYIESPDEGVHVIADISADGTVSIHSFRDDEQHLPAFRL